MVLLPVPSVGYRLRKKNGWYLIKYTVARKQLRYFSVFFSRYSTKSVPVLCFGISRYSRMSNTCVGAGIVSIYADDGVRCTVVPLYAPLAVPGPEYRVLCVCVLRI